MNSLHNAKIDQTPLFKETTKNMPYTWLEISRSALDHNIAHYRDLIGAHNKLAIVIKGNGYGHGLHEIAYLCSQNNFVDWICVAQLSEAIALCNIAKPILVLGYADVDITKATHKNISFMVDSIEYAQMFNSIGKIHSYQFPIHIKIDTGLSRMGILASSALKCIQKMCALDFIKVSGIYSHFSASDSDFAVTQKQLMQFNAILEMMSKHTINIENVHMSNTASINNLTVPSSSNFFRLGLGAYGLGQHSDKLQPVMSWKTQIAHIKIIPAGSYVSYAGTYKTNRKTRIALLPIGYYDGYDFRFSNKASVIINGHYAPILGRVAMNVTIVDITDIAAHTGDEVMLLGRHAGINAQELAQHADIKNVRELLTGINPMIARIITT